MWARDVMLWTIGNEYIKPNMLYTNQNDLSISAYSITRNWNAANGQRNQYEKQAYNGIMNILLVFLLLRWKRNRKKWTQQFDIKGTKIARRE